MTGLKKRRSLFSNPCRQSDIIARWGGDELAIILPNTDKETANAIRDKINAAFNNVQDQDILISLSLGVATKTDGDIPLSLVFKEAEDLMYQVKLTEGREFRRAIAETFGKVLQSNDYEMKGHIERIETLAEKFALVLGFSNENLNSLVRAATLHDIGKIGISKDLILKKSPLNDAEKIIMQKHAEIGYRIVMASGEFAYLADIILYHHEWWNGQGYPQGLKGEEIPLMSRILSILDAFDAMTHRQQDKPAMTAEEALTELQLQEGSQFDPDLTRTFIRMMNESPADLR